MILSIKENTITAHGFIWEGDGIHFSDKLAQIADENDKVIIKLHTYGGVVFDGNMMINALREAETNIELQIIGVAASMGAMLSTAVDNVKIVRNGFMMIHSPSGYTSGTASDHESSAVLLRSMEKGFRSELIRKTGQSKRKVNQWMKGDNWFDAEAALAAGLVSEIIDPLVDIDIDDIEPEQIGAAGMFNRFAAALLPKDDKRLTINNSKTTMKKAIIDALRLEGVSERSSDTAVIDAVRNYYEAEGQALENQLDKAQKELKGLKAKMQKESEQAVTSLLEDAEKVGKITAKQKDTFKKIAESNGIDALKEVLDTIPGRKSLSGQVAAAGSQAPVGRESWTFDQWQKEDPKGLEARAKEDPEWFEELYKQKFN